MKASEIAAAILALKDMEDLKVVNEAVAYQWKRVTAANAKAFRIGQKVEWKSKYGRVETGTVAKVNQKTVQVKATSGVTWRVSPSLLKKVA